MRCYVPNCRNARENKAKLIAFAFPKKNKQAWCEILQMDVDAVTENARVCIEHFTENDYFKFSTKMKLKLNAMPKPVDIAPIEPEVINIIENRRIPRVQIRRRKKVVRKVRPTINPPLFCVERFMNNDRKIFHFTGIQSFEMYLAIFRYVLKNEEGPKGTVHYKKLKGICKKQHKLTPINEMFLTLVRIRRGMDLTTLSVLFNISTSSAGRIFNTWINLLYLELSNLNFFPPREILLSQASAKFIKKYPKVIGSIDCTEFYIQSPSSLVRQSQCFSHYKNTTTLKALVMINPSGAIIFVSNLFAGSISDKRILEESEFLWLLQHKLEKGHLEKGDIILGDKGFKVEEMFQEIGMEINIPTFLVNGMQFLENEVEYIRHIARERVHVERAIRRIKSYKFLSNVIPISAFANINQIFTVCAILTSFMSPLIKNP